MLYLPDGIWTVGPGNVAVNYNCQLYSGYHWYDPNDTKLAWGVTMQCPTKIMGLGKFDSATWVGSHEIIEGLTDPTLEGWSLQCANGTPPQKCTVWQDVPAWPGEAGDLCAWTHHEEAGFTFTRIWSNAAAASGGDPCVPAVASPYVCVSTAQEWYAIQPGQSLPIPITGWADAPSSDWSIAAYVYQQRQGPQFQVSTSQKTINAGQQATLNVVAPPWVTSGAWAAIGIHSALSATSEVHPWAVGVYVP
jgi:hypothetical protein